MERYCCEVNFITSFSSQRHLNRHENCSYKTKMARSIEKSLISRKLFSGGQKRVKGREAVPDPSVGGLQRQTFSAVNKF